RAALDDGVGRLGHHDAGLTHRAAGMAAPADARDVGIAGEQAHLRKLDTEPLDEELGEARLVPLARRERADDHVDPAVGPHGDLGALSGCAGVQLEVVRQPDAAVAAAATRLGAARLESLP